MSAQLCEMYFKWTNPLIYDGMKNIITDINLLLHVGNFIRIN